MKWSEAMTWNALVRKRTTEDDDGKQYLARTMGLFDLTALGVGSTLGLGAYVLAGRVAKEIAGPAVCISFLIAAIASAFSGICYAEFASRVPKAGSAYVYSYVTIGEFIAFIIGWNLVLEYAIGNASVARGLSQYVDNLMGNPMSIALNSTMHMNVSFLSEYPDFFALSMVYLTTVFISIGVRESSILNNIFTIVNVTTIIIVIFAGAFKASLGNWNIAPENIPANVTKPGDGGFLPFGMKGVLTGAATCFFGFVGFDAVATTAEEAKNPQRNIPLAIIISLGIIFAAYFGVAAVLTLMCPYYELDKNAPFPRVFDKFDLHSISIIVSIGAICALCTNLLGTLFPLPRVLYAMGKDGVIFRFFSKVNSKTKTPVVGTLIAGTFNALMTLLFNLEQLIDMMSIGTLMAYTVVAVCVLILRYQEQAGDGIRLANSPCTTYNTLNPLSLFKRIFNFQRSKDSSTFSSNVAKYGVVFYSVMVLIFGLLLECTKSLETNTCVLVYIVLAIIALTMAMTIVAISRQPTAKAQLSFKVPLVPILPCFSIFINIYLMLQLDMNTWIRFLAWMVFGFCIYFTYGITHSTQGNNNKSRKIAEQIELET